MFTKRTLRSKSHNVSYDDEQLAGRKYDVLERLEDPKFSAACNYVREMQPGELTLQYVQEHGLSEPLVLHSYEGLGMRLPPRGFSVQDVKKYVGSRRMLDVIDCNTQESQTMSLGAWVRYYQSAQREHILNVISLEFSHTSMDRMVQPPALVRQLDWAELVWPRSLKDQQTDPTNDITTMKYPKVQKYCLMSVAGCYTDFHLDFGGTSVWYHVFEGKKTFLLVPPTPENYQAFHKWQKGGQQDAIFFPDTVLACQIVYLKAGDTFFLPSGWIHAVYTPQDSLVFGGNFLHTCNIPAQIKVKEMEDTLKVPEKFRYPFYSQIHWYVLAAFIERLKELGVDDSFGHSNGCHSDGNNGRDPLSPPEYADHLPIRPVLSQDQDSRPYISSSEREGLQYLMLRIRQDHLFTDDIPTCVPNTAALLDRLEVQLCSPKLCTALSCSPNGVALITPTWLGREKPLESLCGMEGPPIPNPLPSSPSQRVQLHAGHNVTPPSVVTRSRRRRCLVCVACLRPPCGYCRYCLDSPKFGGPGHLKQSCIHRKCEQLLQECSTMERHCAPYQAAVMTTVPPEEPYDCMEDTSDTVLIEVMSNPRHCTMEQECSEVMSNPHHCTMEQECSEVMSNPRHCTMEQECSEVMSNPCHCTMEQECSAGVNLEDESKDGTSHRSPAHHFSHTEGVVFDTHGTISTD